MTNTTPWAIQHDAARTFFAFADRPGMRDGRVEDESAGGVCIRLGKPLAVGWKLTIQSGGTLRPGIVQRCERNQGAFLLGVKWEGR